MGPALPAEAFVQNLDVSVLDQDADESLEVVVNLGHALVRVPPLPHTVIPSGTVSPAAVPGQRRLWAAPLHAVGLPAGIATTATTSSFVQLGLAAGASVPTQADSVQLLVDSAPSQADSIPSPAGDDVGAATGNAATFRARLARLAQRRSLSVLCFSGLCTLF